MINETLAIVWASALPRGTLSPPWVLAGFSFPPLRFLKIFPRLTAPNFHYLLPRGSVNRSGENWNNWNKLEQLEQIGTNWNNRTSATQQLGRSIGRTTSNPTEFRATTYTPSGIEGRAHPCGRGNSASGDALRSCALC